MSHFTQQTVAFLRQLTANNERHWFTDQKERYESDVRSPALAFIRAAGPHLAEISPELVADPRPTGGSLYRIHRDLRFSKGRTPYKPEIRIRIGHRQAKVRPTPGYFLQIL